MVLVANKEFILKQIKKKIEQFDIIIIHGHKNPDGDCYGSQIGLKNIIQNNFPHKKVYIVGETNHYLDFIGKMDQVSDDMYKNALSFVVDCGQGSIVSDQRYKLGSFIIRIDHHIYIDKVGELEWIDDNFSSCSEMIYALKEYYNWNLSCSAALAIYVGILTDTGRFRFHRVDKDTMKRVSALLEYDLDMFEIDKKINIQSLNLLRFKGYICNNFIADKGFIYIKLNSADIIEKFNLNIDEAFSVLNILSNTIDYPVWSMIMENAQTKNVRMSIRSTGPKIDHIARQFGGGGHLKACGLQLDSIEELEKVIKLVQESIQEFNESNCL